MVKKRNNKDINNYISKKLLILIGVVVSVFLVSVLIILIYQKQVDTYQESKKIILPTIAPTPSVREYISKFLKIRFMVPSEFEVSELHNDITLEGKVGEITILSGATNSDSIEAVVFQISDRGTSQVTNKKKFKINGLDVISCNVKSLVSNQPESKGYYFYSAPGAVFSITTSTPELFGELDGIAQSFHYEP